MTMSKRITEDDLRAVIDLAVTVRSMGYYESRDLSRDKDVRATFAHLRDKAQGVLDSLCAHEA